MSSDRRNRSGDDASITRREVLERLGAMGGSSLVMGVMKSWDMTAALHETRPMLTGTPPAKTKVLILGAGVSGLAAGYELGKNNYDYQILEARDRVGGLNWSVSRGMTHTELGTGGETQICQFDEGHYINGGPWRIPHSHDNLVNYCKELGVRLERFNDDNVVTYTDNPSAGPFVGKPVQLRAVQSDMWGYTTELLAKAVNQGSLDAAVSADDKARLVQFLVSAGWLTQDAAYQPQARFRGAAAKYDLTTLLQTGYSNQVRSFTVGTGMGDPVFQPVGGMMQIPLAFQRAIGPRLKLGAEVVSVHGTEKNVKVVYKETKSGKTHELTVDYVICCLPMPILKKLDVSFSPEMATAVKNTNNSLNSKMGLQMKRRFWEEDEGIYGGHLAYTVQATAAQVAALGAGGAAGRAGAPAPAGGGGGRGGAAAPAAAGRGGAAAGPPMQSPFGNGFSYPANDYRAKKGVLLGFYASAVTTNIDGKQLVDLPVKDRIEHVLYHASKVHPQMRQEFENAYAVWWPRIKYSEAAYGSNPGTGLTQLSKADGRIYIGCAGASSDPAWQEGAIEAAWRTTKALHARVMGA